MGTVVSIGEVLWDVLPNGEYLGGAPFNFAANCARLGHDAFFLSAVGEDPLGERTLRAIEAAGVPTNYVCRVPAAPTGVVRVTFDADGQPNYVISRPAAYDFTRVDERVTDAILSRRPDVLYFGTLSQLFPNNRTALFGLIDLLPEAVCFYDVNLRKDSFDHGLLMQLMSRAQVVKMNEHETSVVQQLLGTTAPSLQEFCRSYCRKFGWRAIWITLGPGGCAVFQDSQYLEVKGFPVEVPNPVGAGDAFSAAVCHGMLQRWPILKTADFANRLGAVIAKQPGAIGEWSLQDIEAIRAAQP